MHKLPLVDLLRRRRELPLGEVARLCGDLPQLLDERTAASGDPPPNLLSNLAVVFSPGAEEPGRLADTPVTLWPAFTLHFIEDDDLGSDEQGTVTSTHLAGGAPPLVAFARLLFDLLGGAHRGAIGRRQYSPLPALNEEANTLLREALAGGARGQSCTDFYQQWLRASGLSSTRHGWRIPRWLLPCAAPGEVLRLQPAEAGTPAPTLLARTRFRLGRSRSQADFSTRLVHPDGTLDEAATTRISRIHLTGESTPAGPALRDGDGARPSANGATWRGAPLPWESAVLLTAPGELSLGGACRLAVTPIPAPALPAPIENLASWAGDSSPPRDLIDAPAFGAVHFQPLQPLEPAEHPLWLGQGIGFRFESAFLWSVSPGQPACAHFLHRHGCFWLANDTLPGDALRLEEAPLEPGQIAPLAPGQVLAIAGRRFTLRLA